MKTDKFSKLLRKLKKEQSLTSDNDAIRHILKFWQAFDIDFVIYAQSVSKKLQTKTK